MTVLVATAPAFEILRPMTREQWEALPDDVRAFLPWEDASRATLAIPHEPAPAIDEEQEIQRLLAYFSGDRSRAGHAFTGSGHGQASGGRS